MVRFVLMLGAWLLPGTMAAAAELSRIGVASDGQHFVEVDTGKTFRVWGVNYDHDSDGRLLEEYWTEQWETVVADFHEIKSLGANCVRIHLQFGKFMQTAERADAEALAQLTKLLELAEEVGLYLDITGLACYHKQHVPAWYDQLGEQERWKAQAAFWSAVSKTCAKSPAVFCYDLMNEPVLAGKEPESEWLLGELGGKFFVQRLVLDLGERSRPEVARAWVEKMTQAIRTHDSEHLITVGVIPWVFVFGGGKPLFYSENVGQSLDFVSVHFYPESGETEEALTALKAYDVGKPLVIEEMFPLKCSGDELAEFVRQSENFADGWISFYWGRTAAQLRSGEPTMAAAITVNWLDQFKNLKVELDSF